MQAHKGTERHIFINKTGRPMFTCTLGKEPASQEQSSGEAMPNLASGPTGSWS